MALPTDIDSTYADDPEDASVKAHQQHHDSLHRGQYGVNTVAASGSSLTIAATRPAHHVTMDQDCTFSFGSPTEGAHTILVYLSGAFTPTFPASVDWDSATAPTYATPSLYGFTTLDGGTTWLGTLIGSGLG